MDIKKRHNWTLEEDSILAEAVFKTYVKPTLSKNAEASAEPMEMKDFVSILHKKLSDIEPGSIRMRLSNIKAILTEHKTSNSMKIRELNHPATKTRNAVKACYDKFEIPKPEEF